jgi:hypothetical protein
MVKILCCFLLIILIILIILCRLSVGNEQFINSEDKQIIHIGKCGGSSVTEQLNKYNIFIEYIHIRNNIKYNPKIEYIILIRNPVKRFISAYNWRKRLILNNNYLPENPLLKSEQKLFNKYNTLNNLAENIYINNKLNINFKDKKNYFHHIYEDINYYLEKILTKITKNTKNNIKIITQEYISEDFEKIFNKSLNIKLNSSNEKKDTYLSKLGLKNLKKWLEKDYECIEKLNNLQILSDKQYKILIN